MSPLARIDCTYASFVMHWARGQFTATRLAACEGGKGNLRGDISAEEELLTHAIGV